MKTLRAASAFGGMDGGLRRKEWEGGGGRATGLWACDGSVGVQWVCVGVQRVYGCAMDLRVCAVGLCACVQRACGCAMGLWVGGGSVRACDGFARVRVGSAGARAVGLCGV